LNILLIVCDTLRADHLGCYGYFRDTSPNIDDVAKDGIIFEDFFNSGAPTGPAFTCIYTGLHSIHHKYYQFGGSGQPNIRQVDDTIFTMPEILRAWGYVTCAVDNLMNFPCHSKHWVRGYEFYINPSKAFEFPPLILAEHVNRRLIPWIRNHSDEEFFLFVHYWDPHLPYNQPKEYREIFRHEKGNLSDLEIREAPAGYQYVPGWGKVGEFVDGEIERRGRKISIDLYDGEVAYVDHEIGKVISTLEENGILEDTLIIITSDHGEKFGGSIGQYGHAWLYDSIVHVPLIMRYPKKLPRGVRVRGFCQHIDLLPTILDLIGAPMDVLQIDGRSMMPLLKGKQIRNSIFMEQTWGQRAIRTSEWKLIADEWVRRAHREPELYNIKEDPMETINLAKINNGKMRGLMEVLCEWVNSNIREGEDDPIIYDYIRGIRKYDEGRRRIAIEYRERISYLLDSFKRAKSLFLNF